MSADLDVGFINMPFARHCALAPVEALRQQGREANKPAMDRRMINADATLGHHLFQIAQAQSVCQIPANAQQDDRSVEVPASEHHKPPKASEVTARQPVTKKFATEPRVRLIEGPGSATRKYALL
jgi:hypothetical protein